MAVTADNVDDPELVRAALAAFPGMARRNCWPEVRVERARGRLQGDLGCSPFRTPEGWVHIRLPAPLARRLLEDLKGQPKPRAWRQELLRQLAEGLRALGAPDEEGVR